MEKRRNVTRRKKDKTGKSDKWQRKSQREKRKKGISMKTKINKNMNLL